MIETLIDHSYEEVYHRISVIIVTLESVSKNEFKI